MMVEHNVIARHHLFQSSVVLLSEFLRELFFSHVHFRIFLRVQDSGDGNTEVGGRAPEVCLGES